MAINLFVPAFRVDECKWNDADEVITTPLTFISTNHSIVLADLTPVFTDVDNSLCLDPIEVENNITDKTRAVLFVGLGGNTGQYKRIVDICRKYDLNLNKIYLHVFENNIAGIKSYLSAGFKLEGTLREYHKMNEDYINVLHMGILKRERGLK
jgi:hypothetical protein